jgi:hemoglobin-like flavoprotein
MKKIGKINYNNVKIILIKIIKDLLNMIKIKILKFWEIFYHNVGQIIKIIKIL